VVCSREPASASARCSSPGAAAASSGGGAFTSAESITHVRWVITRSKGESLIQATELVLLAGVTPLPNLGAPATGIVVTNPGGLNPDPDLYALEGPEQCYDGNPTTKWLDFNFSAAPGAGPVGEGGTYDGESILVIAFPDPVTFTRYQWVTGNDEPRRDPISWRIEVSTDGLAWSLFDVRTDVAVTDDRGATVGPFPPTT
jgi:hypothetical protein